MKDVIFIIKDRKLVDSYMVVSDDFIDDSEVIHQIVTLTGDIKGHYIDDSEVIHQIATLTGDIKGHYYSWISLSSLNRLHDEISTELFNEIFPYYRDAMNLVGRLFDGGEIE